ncbi:D-glycero-alpha-D-manno-heptose-1,7-bisphosphate 7-phosphatase [Thermodesulfobacteriota bacterium]
MEGNGKSKKVSGLRRPAVFLDRDGTINEQMGYINHLSRFVLLPRVPEAIKLLNQRNFLVIIITNQSGVARGYFPVGLVDEVHDYMRKTLEEQGAVIDDIFFCPHHPRGIIPEFREACDCRKPKTGLVDQACQSFNIDLSRSYVVGDRYTDIELAETLGIGSVMVETGYGKGDMAYILPRKSLKPTFIAADLFDAVTGIIKREQAFGSD